MSAVGNHTHAECNPLRNGTVSGTRTTTVVLGAVFTFLAIAYSTSRAATQSRALVGKNKKTGPVALPDAEDGTLGDHGLVTTQPGKIDSPRYQALLAAVEAGYEIFFSDVYTFLDLCLIRAIPASALNETNDDDDDDDDEVTGDDHDDEKSGTRYNVRPSVICYDPNY